MNVCYLGLGSNQKSPERQLRQALFSIQCLPSTTIKKVSKLHWTKAWGLHAQQDFCNAAIEIVTRLTPLDLLKACQKIEKTQGRIRKKRWGPRVIDIDILIYSNRRMNLPNLIIPHPHILSRDFVLLPLKEINATLELNKLVS